MGLSDTEDACPETFCCFEKFTSIMKHVTPNEHELTAIIQAYLY